MRGKCRVSLGVDKFSFLAYNVYIVNSGNEREIMATFAEQIEKMIERAPVRVLGANELYPDNEWCKFCSQLGMVNKNGFCAKCQGDVDRGYTISAKAGRCANGAERDSGTLFHIRLMGEHGPNWAPLCGKEPGRRSAGWSTWRPAGQVATCPTCLKRLRSLERRNDG